MALWSTIVGIIAVVCAVWVIYDVLVNRKKMEMPMKIIWIVCAIIFSIITAIVYYLIGRK